SNQNLAAASFARNPAAVALLPGGNVLFDDNQSRTGPLNRSTVCQWIASLDDIGYQGNQSTSERAGNLFANVFLGAATLRAIGNRMSELGPETLMSLFTLTQRLNDTSLNQGDHCIIAINQDTSLAEVQLGNQVLNPGPLCARFAAVA